MKHRIRAVCSAILVAAAVQAPAQELSAEEFNAFVRGLRQFDPQWAGPSRKACDQIDELLKQDNLSLDQQGGLLAERYPYARRLGDAEADAVWTRIAALPDSPARKAAMLKVIGTMPFEATEKAARANPDLFASKIALCAHLATAAIKAGQIEAAVRLAREIRAEPVAEPRKGDPRQAPLKAILTALAYADYPAAKAFYPAIEELFGADAPYLFLPVFLETSQRARDRQAFDAELAAARRRADPGRRFDTLLVAVRCLRAGGAPAAGGALLAELEQEADTDAKQLSVLQLRVPALPRYFEYGLPPKDIYRQWKAAIGPAIALQEKLNTRAPGFLPAAAQYDRYAGEAFTFGDYAFADDLLKKFFTLQPEAFSTVQLELALYRNNRELAAGQIARALADQRIKPGDIDYFTALRYFDNGGNLAGLDRAVFGDRKAAPEERLTLLRRASHTFFRAYRYDVSRAIESEIRTNMFNPFVRPSYVVRFDRQAPRSADSWAQSPRYNDWNQMFTAFEVRGKNVDLNQRRDLERHLKNADAPRTDPTYRTGLQVLCDVSGVHFYGRFADPQPQDFVLRRRSGGEAEFNLRPGRDTDFHYTAFLKDLPEVGDPYEVEWALPSKKYKMGGDFIRKDAVPTSDGLAVHVFVPWQMVYTHLPLDGETWGLGFGRHGTDVQGKDFSYTVCGARAQELERSLELKFQFTTGELKELKRSICQVAFNTYDALRHDKNGCIFLWNDPTIGDRKFYAAAVAPLIEELDDAGKGLLGGLSDGDVDCYLGKHVPRWFEVKHLIEDLRVDYLRNAVQARFE